MYFYFEISVFWRFSGKETSQEYNTPAAVIGVGGKGTTRRGRVIRSPQAFWKGIFL